MSHEAYARAQKEGGGPRDVEYRAFARATRALMAAGEAGHADLKGLIEALHLNRSLWGALANDCAREDNRLPEDTRARIIALSRWVSNYSSDVMRRRESLEPLIDVNRIMMDGLAGKSAQTAPVHSA